MPENAKRRIVVLGAAGFIGRRLIDTLSNDPETQVVAAVRAGPRAAFPAGVETLVLDATDASALRNAVLGSSGVVNCVAGSSVGIVSVARALAYALNECTDPPAAVHLSSLAVYGSASGVVDESAPLLGDLDDYSAAKATAERALSGQKTVSVLRPGIVYGPGSPLWSRYIGHLLWTHRLGDLGDAGAGICNLAHVDDVVNAIRRCLSPVAAGQAFNIGGAAPPTWNEYFRRYAAALEAAPLRRISAWRLALETGVIAPAIKLAELATGRRSGALAPAIRPWLLALCRHSITMNVGRAEAVLGMTWHPLDQGLETTAKWFRDAQL